MRRLDIWLILAAALLALRVIDADNL